MSNSNTIDGAQWEEDIRRAIEESKRESERDWISSSSRKKGHTKSSQSQSDVGVRNFLSKFKTSPCKNEDYHDHRKCMGYHSAKDMRRDPYVDYYLPDDEDLKSNMEVMYHPIIYLTKLCDRPNQCPFGRYCAKAHDRSTIKNTAIARYEYSAHWTNMTALKKRQQSISLGAYVRTTPTCQVSASSGSKKWNTLHHNLPKCSEYLFQIDRDSKSWFLINSSKQFFSFLKEVAMKEGLTQIEIRNNHWNGEFGIAIRGNNQARDCVMGLIASHLFEPPTEYFVQETKPFSSRVIKKLCKKSKEEIYGKYAKRAFIEFSDDEITLCASNHPRNAGKQIIFDVFEKLSFWVTQEGHDKFIDCCICMDSYNLDEGVQCINAHFYCGGSNGCVGGMVKEHLSACITKIIQSYAQCVRRHLIHSPLHSFYLKILGVNLRKQ